ncbi:hypothetical protein L195_g031043 [Trifolium pratense]|uniref:Uncharacterized protein n=1 Tax=Trifolium pratense TaxID=57577 RepID=A0A2K3L9A5_TRIPR|nr:hypothetical protein L195_g031043 [Trifolium pratense]
MLLSQPITMALVYAGTTLKDLSDVTRDMGEFSKTRLAFIIFSVVMSVVMMICVTKVAKSTLDKALAECEQDTDEASSSAEQPMVVGRSVDLNEPGRSVGLNEPLVEIEQDQEQDNQQK